MYCRIVPGAVSCSRGFVNAGRVHATRRWSFPAHRHCEYECLLVRSGRIRYWIDDREFPGQAGDLYFIQPGQFHREESETPGLDYYFLKFVLRDADGHPVYLLPPPGDPPRQRLRDRHDAFYGFIRAILDEVAKERPGSLEIVDAVIAQMIWRILRWTRILPAARDAAQQSRRISRLVEQARGYLDANLGRNIALTELGHYCNVSPDHLWHLFKKATGTSPKQYALNARIARSQRLLAETDQTIFAIARQLGFNGHSHFTRSFKTATGQSPSVFRSLHSS